MQRASGKQQARSLERLDKAAPQLREVALIAAGRRLGGGSVSG